MHLRAVSSGSAGAAGSGGGDADQRVRQLSQINAQSNSANLTTSSASADLFISTVTAALTFTDRRFNQFWNEQLDQHAEERKAAENAAAAAPTSTRDRSSSTTAAAVPQLFSEDDCGLCSNELRDGCALYKSAAHDQPHAPCSSPAAVGDRASRLSWNLICSVATCLPVTCPSSASLDATLADPPAARQ
jgi:hypothetical protein